MGISTCPFSFTFCNSRQGFVKLDRGPTSGALYLLNQPRSQTDQVKNVRASQLFAFTDIAKTNTALEFATFWCLNVFQLLKLVYKLSPLIQSVQSSAESGQAINYLTQQVNRNSTVNGYVPEEGDIEYEVSNYEDQIDEVENELFFKPLLLVVKLEKLDLVLKVVVYCL